MTADLPGHSSLLQDAFLSRDLLWPSAMHVPSLLTFRVGGSSLWFCPVAQALVLYLLRLLVTVFSSQGTQTKVHLRGECRLLSPPRPGAGLLAVLRITDAGSFWSINKVFR